MRLKHTCMLFKYFREFSHAWQLNPAYRILVSASSCSAHAVFAHLNKQIRMPADKRPESVVVAAVACGLAAYTLLKLYKSARADPKDKGGREPFWTPDVRKISTKDEDAVEYVQIRDPTDAAAGPYNPPEDYHITTVTSTDEDVEVSGFKHENGELRVIMLRRSPRVHNFMLTLETTPPEPVSVPSATEV